MSTQLESWKYFADENVESSETGEKTLNALPGAVEDVATHSVPLMLLQGAMGVVGFLGIVSALRSLKGLFDAGMVVEAMEKGRFHGLETGNAAMAAAEYEWMFLIITVAIIKIIISCGFMGAALMMEKRVDYANWFAGLVCFGAIVFNLIAFGVNYMIIPDFTKYGMTAADGESYMLSLLLVMSVFFAIKMAIYLGLMVFLNNKTNNEIFTPKSKERVSIA